MQKLVEMKCFTKNKSVTSHSNVPCGNICMIVTGTRSGGGGGGAE